MSLSAASSKLRLAQMYLTSRRFDEAGAAVEEAAELLVGLPEEETEPVLAQVAALRVEAAEGAAAERYGPKIRAAERELRYAKEDIEKGNVAPSGIEYRFDHVVEYLQDVPDNLKAALLDENEVLRAVVAARAGGTPAPVASPQPAASPEPVASREPVASPEPSGREPSLDEQRTVSQVRTRISQARSLLQSRWGEGVDGVLDEAVAMLAGVAEDTRAPFLAEIEALRAEVAPVQQAEYARGIESEFKRHFFCAEDDYEVRTRPGYAAQAIEHLSGRLADEELRRRMPPDALAQYETRLAAARAKLASAGKDAALERALPMLAELEQLVAGDPFAGLDQSAAYNVTSQLDSLRVRTLEPLRDLPEDDADVVAIKARIAAADERIEQASQAWGMAGLHESVRESWATTQRDPELAGWRDEVAGPASGLLLAVPELPKTRTAVLRIGALLTGPQATQVRAEHPGDEVIEATYRAAEQDRDAAAAKLAAAYQEVLAAAEQVETPMLDDELNRTMHFATAIEASFEGTAEREPLLARVEALAERWKAEGAAIRAARQALYDKLAAEADVLWPAIVAACSATEDFDPGDTTAAGKTVLLSGVYNRAGWDFKNYDFCMRWSGIPVGGSYEPHVTQALEHAWYTLKLDVSDRITWDVIGVVQGPGKIGERHHVSVKGSDGLEIGKVEEWTPVECVRLKIIGLRAGAVAVGPDHEWRPTA